MYSNGKPEEQRTLAEARRMWEGNSNVVLKIYLSSLMMKVPDQVYVLG
jgi:hypothetical protein